jgi:hypothetical protein
MVCLHLEAARAIAGKFSLGWPASMHRQLVAPTNVGVDLIIGITGHVQDHLLTNPYVDLLPIRRWMVRGHPGAEWLRRLLWIRAGRQQDRQACIIAYAVIGPKKRKPRALRGSRHGD